MTRKDYVLIAEALRVAREIPCGTVLQMHSTVALELAGTLADTNPRFDRERFLKAAGVES